MGEKRNAVKKKKKKEEEGNVVRNKISLKLITPGKVKIVMEMITRVFVSKAAFVFRVNLSTYIRSK